MRQAESAALKAAGLTETGKKSGTFKRELAAVFSQVRFPSFMRTLMVGEGYVDIFPRSFEFCPKDGWRASGAYHSVRNVEA